MAPRLDAIVARQWHDHSLVLNQASWEMFDEHFRLALRHGQTSALQRLYLLLNTPGFDHGFEPYLANSLADEIPMPGVAPRDRYNNDLVLAWARKHRPEDFVFNRALRQFILQPGLSATETASNP